VKEATKVGAGVNGGFRDGRKNHCEAFVISLTADRSLRVRGCFLQTMRHTDYIYEKIRRKQYLETYNFFVFVLR
jgi:hypothetical protein